MKSLKQFILEAEEQEDEYTQELDDQEIMKDIKFTIWQDFETKVQKLKSNKHYQKIEYKYNNQDLGVEIDFLLGFDKKTWWLWIGKVGSCGYDDNPYEDLETDDFNTAIVNSLDIIVEYIKDVLENKEEYLEYYDD